VAHCWTCLDDAAHDTPSLCARPLLKGEASFTREAGLTLDVSTPTPCSVTIHRSGCDVLLSCGMPCSQSLCPEHGYDVFIGPRIATLTSLGKSEGAMVTSLLDQGTTCHACTITLHHKACVHMDTVAILRLQATCPLIIASDCSSQLKGEATSLRAFVAVIA
jgi:hypothetical protein